MLAIRTSSKDDDKTNLRIVYNMEVPRVMLAEMKTRLPSIISAVRAFADKYRIFGLIGDVKNFVVERVTEAYNGAIHYDIEMSQLSIFFRSIIVQYQRTVQVFLDAAIKVLRETQFKLPGSEELTTLPEVLKRVTSSIAALVDMFLQKATETAEIYYTAIVEKISTVKLRMPIGDVITGNQILERVKSTVRTIVDEVVDFVRNMESIDMMLEKIGETLKAVVDKSQEFVDSIKSDYLDAVFMNINALYLNLLTVVKRVLDPIAALDMEHINGGLDYIIDWCVYVVDLFNTSLSHVLAKVSDEVPAFAKFNEGRVEIDLPFAFRL